MRGMASANLCMAGLPTVVVEHIRLVQSCQVVHRSKHVAIYLTRIFDLPHLHTQSCLREQRLRLAHGLVRNGEVMMHPRHLFIVICEEGGKNGCKCMVNMTALDMSSRHHNTVISVVGTEGPVAVPVRCVVPDKATGERE